MKNIIFTLALMVSPLFAGEMTVVQSGAADSFKGTFIRSGDSSFENVIKEFRIILDEYQLYPYLPEAFRVYMAESFTTEPKVLEALAVLDALEWIIVHNNFNTNVPEVVKPLIITSFEIDNINNAFYHKGVNTNGMVPGNNSAVTPSPVSPQN